MKILLLLILTACSKPVKNCELLGEWKSITFTSDKAVDMNNDGVYNTDLLKEDLCTAVTYNFMSNGKVKRSYKNNRLNCEYKTNTLDYIIDGDSIEFTVSGMKQRHKFDITDCKLTFYAVHGSGKTSEGNQNFSINSTFEKK